MRGKRQFVLLLLTLALSISTTCYGQNYLSGTLSGTLEPAIYIVVGDCFIDSGSVLEVQSGTEFLFAGHYSWYVRGILRALGSSTPIRFRRQYPTPACIWGGIRFIDSGADQSILDNCHIEWVNRVDPPEYYGGGILASGANPTISNTTIRNCWAEFGGGICAIESSQMIVDGCILMGNTAFMGGGIEVMDTSSVMIRNSIFFRNTSTGT